jgi:tRNA dimethylallyltransferase
MTKQKALIISGPTASGKSNLALEIANYRDIAIINADSLQIYQGLPILSAQPSKDEQKNSNHYLYSHLKPFESSSVASWLELIKEIIPKVLSEKKLPVLVGGSGMYLSKLIEGISKIPEISEENRKNAIKKYEELGHDNFQKMLFELTGEKILDKQRLTRAFEVYSQTKKPISFWQKQEKEKILPEIEFVHFNLNPNREKLYKNCDLRFQKIFDQGGVKEVQKFLKKYQNRKEEIFTWQISKTLGFEEIHNFLSKKITKERAIEIAAQKTRNYAKRQLTYFRNQLRNKLIFENPKEVLDYLLDENFDI